MVQRSVINDVNKVRLKTGITQEQLAGAVEVSRQTIIAIEKGNYVPSVALALRIAEFFHEPVEKLFHLS